MALPCIGRYRTRYTLFFKWLTVANMRTGKFSALDEKNLYTQKNYGQSNYPGGKDQYIPHFYYICRI